MTRAEQEEDAILAEMLAEAEAPTKVKKGSVINRSSNSSAPFPMIVSEIENDGTENAVIIYDTETGDPSLCPPYEQLLKAKLNEKREDGSPRWTQKDPGFRPPTGDGVCYLHPSHPDRAQWDAMGMTKCSKTGFFNEWDLVQHMSHKHGKEWNVMSEARVAKEREEDRAFQRMLMERVTGGAS